MIELDFMGVQMELIWTRVELSGFSLDLVGFDVGFVWRVCWDLM